MRTAIFCLVAVMAHGAPALGDAGFSFLRPAPDIEITLENAADFADYDFYLKCASGPGNPYASPQRVAVEEGTGRISGSRGDWVTWVYLLAAPRGTKLPPPGSNVRRWLDEPEEGCMQSKELEGGSRSGAHTYRISVSDGKLETKLVATDNSAARRREGFTIAAGLAGALGLVTLPLILLRRRAQARRREEAELAKAER